MTDLKTELYQKVKAIMDGWQESDVYAISFFVYSNGAYEYKGYSNVSYFAISCNTEADCNGAKKYDEERWNYAFWRQDEQAIIYHDEPNRLTDLLFEWYQENGITAIGEEDEDNDYDDDSYYIGKGPVGHYELLTLVAEVAERLQREGYVAEQFGKPLPIIVHGLEYAWYDIEATKKANPNGEADVFLKAAEKLGFI